MAQNLDAVVKKAAGTAASTLNRVLAPRNADRVGVLMYHRTAPVTSVDAEDDLNVTPDTFRAQLSGLQDSGYNFISIDELINWHSGGGELAENSVHVTFDDGYACTALLAAPILKDLGIPATVFVNTAFIGGEGPFPFDPNGDKYAAAGIDPNNYRPMSPKELEAVIADSTITIGAHSHTHSNFAENPDKFDEDVILNMKVLRDDYGLETVPFAFPYGVVRLGYAGGELSRKAAGLGVTCAFSTEPDLIDQSDDLFCLGRFSAYPWDTAQSLGAKLNGWFSWVPKAQALAGKAKARLRRS